MIIVIGQRALGGQRVHRGAFDSAAFATRVVCAGQCERAVIRAVVGEDLIAGWIVRLNEYGVVGTIGVLRLVRAGANCRACDQRTGHERGPKQGTGKLHCRKLLAAGSGAPSNLATPRSAGVTKIARGNPLAELPAGSQRSTSFPRGGPSGVLR